MKKKKAALITVGTVLALNAVLMTITSNINAGIIVEFLLGAVFLLYGFTLGKIMLPKWLKTIFWSGVSVVTIFTVFLFTYGISDNISGREDALIVLGSGIRGEQLTVGLRNRLDEAIECYEENNNLLIVVSGGQGSQEDITEALAMERYLLSCGIPQEKIIKEENATSTYENFVYSKQILNSTFGDDYEVAFVTNDYHIYRAGSLAKIAGFEYATHSHSSTMWYTVIPSCIRECMAVIKLWVFKQ